MIEVSEKRTSSKKPKSTSRNSTGKRARTEGSDSDAEYDPHARSVNSAGSIAFPKWPGAAAAIPPPASVQILLDRP